MASSVAEIKIVSLYISVIVLPFKDNFLPAYNQNRFLTMKYTDTVGFWRVFIVIDCLQPWKALYFGELQPAERKASLSSQLMGVNLIFCQPAPRGQGLSA